MKLDLKELKTTNKFLSTFDLSQIFGVTRQTICDWVKRGVLPNKKRIAGVYGWDPDELRKFLDVKP